MRIFLSHASDDKPVAESIAFSLRNRGHTVFLDKDDLPPGKSYDEQIETAVGQSDIMIFLISPQSVAPRRYTLTELEYARRRWLSPDHRVLPVIVSPTPMDQVPAYLKAVTVLEPKGNVTAEVASAAVSLRSADYAMAQAMPFAVVGALAGTVAAFAPFKMTSLTGIKLAGVAPDIGIVAGLGLGFALWRFAPEVRRPWLAAVTGCVVAWLIIGLLFDAGIFSAAGFGLEDIAKSIEATNEIGAKRLRGLDAGVDWAVQLAAYTLTGLGYALIVHWALVIVGAQRTGFLSHAIVAMAGLLAGALFQATIFTLGKPNLQLIKTVNSAGEPWIIWATPGMVVAFGLWLAVTFWAVGFTLARGGR